MTSGNPEDDEARAASEPPRRVVGPWLFSLLLHGVLVVLFARAAFAPAEARITAERPNVRVILAMRPRRPEPELVTPVVEPPAPEEVEEEIEEVVEQPGATPDALSDATAMASAPPDAANAAESGAAGASIPAWTPARIREVIQNDSGARRSAVTEAWIAGCIVEQKERGTRDCERQLQEQDYASAGARAGSGAAEASFKRITRVQRADVLAQRFLRTNALLGSMMEEGGVTGAAAAERYYLNQQYILYLTGNGQDPLFGAMQGFSADVLSGPQLSLPGNILFRCKRQPCSYEFNGFELEPPEDAAAADEFRVVPTPFGDRR